MTLVNASGVNRQHFSSSRGGWHTLLSKMMFTLVYRTSEITFFLLQKLQNSLGTRLRFRVWFSLDWVCNISSTSEPRTGPSTKVGIPPNPNPNLNWTQGSVRSGSGPDPFRTRTPASLCMTNLLRSGRAFGPTWSFQVRRWFF